MADIYGSHFEYRSRSSREFGLMISTVESERMTDLYGSISGITMFNKSTNQRYLVNDDMSESPLSFEVEIVSDDQRILDFRERRAIEKWIFNKHSYSKLYIDTLDDCQGETFEMVDGTIKRIYLYCRFVNPQKLEYNGGIVGYRAMLETDSNMFWQDPIIKSFPITNETSSDSSIVTIYIDSDIDDYIYPKVTFTVGDEGGDIIITNTSDDNTRFTKFVGLPPSAIITMRGDINYISGGQYYEKFAYRNFVRLLDGTNNLSIIGDVTNITIEYQNRRLF